MPMAKTIVFVDDELDMRIFLSAVLKSGGFTPVQARNASEGMQKVRDTAPDLVIMDVMMPKSGVTEKAFSHHVKMVNLRLDDTLPPPDAYLEKPLDPEKLLATIHRLLP